MDDLSQLNLCEADWISVMLDTYSVVFNDVWGTSGYDDTIKPLLDRVGAKPQNIGLHHEGITVTFATMEEASLVRLFYKGDTLTGA